VEGNLADGRVIESDYSFGPYAYSVATRADDAAVRDILARTPMGGNMRLALRREPDAFATDGCRHSHGYVIAREQHSGKLIGLCERVIREMFVDGQNSRLPYLAALRVLPEFRYRLRAIKGGFEAVRRLLAQPGDLPFALTSIMSDNHHARRLLGKGLPGLPRYEPAGDLSTFALAASAGKDGCERATTDDLPEISGLLMHSGARTQFACAWRLETLRALEESGLLRARDYLLIRRAGRIQACAALWDQSPFRQVVVESYSPWLGYLRPALNFAAHVLRQPRLPAPGQTLRIAYVSHVGMRDENDEDLRTLVEAARTEARSRGIDTVLCGWATQHSMAEVLRDHTRSREFRSQLYIVRWPEDPAPAFDAARRPAPEIALL
jgi:hypothetical protein